MLRHRLAGAEASGDRSRAAPGEREDRVEHPLAGDQRLDGRQTPDIGAGDADRPLLGERQLARRAVGQFDGHDRFRDRVGTVRLYFLHHRFGDQRGHHAAVQDRRRFLRFRDDLACGDRVAGMHLHLYVPFPRLIQCGGVDAAGDVFAGRLGDLLEGTLNAVVDIVENARAERDEDRLVRAVDELARLHAGSLLIDLDGGRVSLQRDNLADETLFADVDHFGHPESRGVLQIDYRSVDAVNYSGLLCAHSFSSSYCKV